jgi:hypothetical protein
VQWYFNKNSAHRVVISILIFWRCFGVDFDAATERFLFWHLRARTQAAKVSPRARFIARASIGPRCMARKTSHTHTSHSQRISQEMLMRAGKVLLTRAHAKNSKITQFLFSLLQVPAYFIILTKKRLKKNEEV